MRNVPCACACAVNVSHVCSFLAVARVACAFGIISYLVTPWSINIWLTLCFGVSLRVIRLTLQPHTAGKHVPHLTTIHSFSFPPCLNEINSVYLLTHHTTIKIRFNDSPRRVKAILIVDVGLGHYI